ncbi:alpha-ketoacid dehydrogenase subunit beta [Malaciobacter mytili LMG 24559]|uniref:Alpha-ketoacid dehydrogenase subunit beta n=1 Tax=Malaciobacter mytili LMG 24559 TaxID=1032238 RepID=A0AAX2ALB0_9BACT|nr:transketolase C-terminal domain-containing protein [Malaciobacter mytili]AXH16138.1 TPP-dependent dehydrogenase, beta subunit [Malaciobacter mytili LMG 24559]RXK17038.1 alpha-ketoacid dehydrogenase subunit beta [Malaciobacter mytili LMG 24559]
MKKTTFAQAINEALETALRIDNTVIKYGLGVTDPYGVFGTTKNLHKFSQDRVFDMPTAENAMTGVAIGAAMGGLKPIMTHQRLDFFLLAMDQLVNNASKFYFMFGKQINLPITIRLIIGRGWGQGPTHSQSLQAWFAHIPGLKVVMPTTVKDAKGLLLESIFDPNPVLFLEHRWLHNLEGEVEESDNFRVAIGKAEILKEGNDITIISMSYMSIEALHAIKELEKYNISCELIDLKTISPIDWETIFKSIEKTQRVIVLDTSYEFGSIGNDIIAKISIEYFNKLKVAPKLIALPNIHSPTSYSLTKEYYKDAKNIIEEISTIFNININLDNFNTGPHHDIPGDWFKGPF